VCRAQERLYTNPKLHIKCNSNKSMNIDKVDELIWNSILEVWKNSYMIKEQFKKDIIVKNTFMYDRHPTTREKKNGRSHKHIG